MPRLKLEAMLSSRDGIVGRFFNEHGGRATERVSDLVPDVGNAKYLATTRMT